MDIQYIGEHLLPGKIGHFFVILAFMASVVAVIAYFSATRSKDLQQERAWRNLGRSAFLIQLLSVFGTFASLCWIIFNHYFEYSYVWEYTSKESPVQFLIAAVWNGQEGSFLLWSIWNSILGAILLRTSGKWESPVMAVISLAQVGLGSMLLGIYIFGAKIGSDPFILFREANPSLPVFANANYLSFIQDGQGLNPLLQNYWMTIHPPVLFCGFASTIIPFAYAVAGLWTRQFGDWIKPALPWALFSAMVLGTGILMGGAWAYETLSFGGFWAWDPVENASFVPWLIMVGGLHTLLIYKSTGRSLKITFFLFIMSFTMVLYSTFLTRSGILGETSVHSFTSLGMSGQLLVFLFIFFLGALTLFFIHFNKIPSIKTEEAVNTREFWMFIGALVLLLGAIFVTFSTSIPVWNKLFNLNLAPPVEPKFHYNKVMIFIGILVALGTAVIQYLKYKKNNNRASWKGIWKPLVISLILGTLIVIFGNVDYRAHGLGFLIAIDLLIYCSLFAVAANVGYIFSALKGKMKNAGASVAHVGFGLMLLGIVISTSKQKAISHDTLGLIGNDYFPAGSAEAKTPQENVYLPRNIPIRMKDFTVTYLGDSTAAGDAKTYYKVHYVQKDAAGNVIQEFRLYPDAFINPRGQEGLIANPDSKHYWDHDIFTYVTSVFDPSKMEDTAEYKSYDVKEGDTVFFSTGYMILEDIVPNPQSPAYHPEPGDLAVGAQLKVFSKQGKAYEAMPIYYLRDSSYQYSVADTVENQALYIRFTKILPQQKKIELEVKQSGIVNDYIVMKAYVFPFINVLWIGTLVMIIGFIMSIRTAYKKLNRKPVALKK